MEKPNPPRLVTRRHSLGDQIYDRLREQIVNLEFVPGQMLYENELSERLGVSRTPVREAIRLLANEQLVDVLPQRGTRVTLISVRKVKEVQFIREQLETGAFREAAKLWDPDRHQPVRERLEECLKAQEKAVRESDLTGNETLLLLINQMRAHLNRVRFLSLLDDRDESHILKEHETLLAAVESGDEQRTAKLLMAHIGKMGDVLRRLANRHPHFFCP
jgi:DNA-binding GntR family transcriptional regulator